MTWNIAVIDIGTISTRLLICSVDEDGAVDIRMRSTTVTKLGEGSRRGSSLSLEAVERTLHAAKLYLERIRSASDSGMQVQAVCTLLTSAAREAQNSSVLLDALHDLGLKPQVITGDTEARAMFFGVQTDFPDESLLVMDVGGGSTEIVAGRTDQDTGYPIFDSVRSIEIGALRLAQSHLSNSGVTEAEELQLARDWLRVQLGGVVRSDDKRSQTVVGVGGTLTTLVAIRDGIEPYDPARVHGSVLTINEIGDIVDRLSGLTNLQRELVVGLQAERSSLIIPGALVIEALLSWICSDVITVSESDILLGVARNVAIILEGRDSPLGWESLISLIDPGDSHVKVR